jgi:hypothetical protein
MTAAAPPFPPGRVLTDWRRQLALQEPCTVWIGYVRMHRMEALARISQIRSPDLLQRALLRAVALMPSRTSSEGRAATVAEDRSADLASLGQWLGLDSALLRRMLAHAESENLVAASDAVDSPSRQTWRLTAAGAQSLETGSYPVNSYERRVFHFLRAAGTPPRHPFLNLASLHFAASVHNHSLTAEPELEAPGPGVLASCISQPPEWKREQGFPVDIAGIVTPGGGGMNAVEGKPASPPPWQRILITQPVQAFLLLVHEADRVRAFAARPEGWILQASPACLILPGGEWQLTFPQLLEEPTVETWRAAWLTWGQSRSLPDADLRACEIASEGFRLRIRVGKRLADRLRAARSEALVGEAWIMAGEGTLRPVRMLEIVAA